MKLTLITALMVTLTSSTLLAQTTEPAPAPPTATLQTLDELVRAIDPDATREGNQWQLAWQEMTLIVVADDAADRMRIISPIQPVDPDDPELMHRLLQANFDAALDARYAVAQGIIWGTFLHPLSSLTQREFASGLIQVVNVVNSFGSTFSSGVFTYGGGDSTDEYRELLRQLESRVPSST